MKVRGEVMDETVYTVGQLADISGTTVRTIQYYDKIGLLVAKRNGDKQARVYSSNDLVRLQQILFYKKLGMSLNDIRQNCLSYGNQQDLKRILEKQSELLFKKEMEIKTSSAVIGAILSTLEKDQTYNVEAIMKLTLSLNHNTIFEYLNMEFDRELEASFQENREDHERVVEIYWRWKRLLLEAISLKNNQIKPESDAGYEFGKKWHAFVQFATNDSQELAEAYSRSYQQSHQWPEEDRLLMDYCDDFIDDSYRYYSRKEESK
jgi:DNA-binding transcriptional MerR regulator